MISVSITGRSGKITSGEVITSGSVGLKVQFRFSGEWSNYDKVALFKGAGVQSSAALTQVGQVWECVVPPECVAVSGTHLMVGAYGTASSGQAVIPTVWIDAGVIREGAVPSETYVQPHPAVPEDSGNDGSGTDESNG